MEIKLKKDAPIGVFDSGVGGISVLRELVHIMPNENYLYFGDSLHAPYGTKTLEEVRKLTIANIEKLLNDGAKGIVVACNTATSAAVAILRKMYPSVPLVGIEPAIKPAVLQKPGSRILFWELQLLRRGKGAPLSGADEAIRKGCTDHFSALSGPDGICRTR